MKILQRYVAGSYLSAFLLGMLVLSFVLSVGLLIKATELVVKGLDPGLVLHFLAVSVPESFTFTIPLASLVSALLVFGRLSADGETSAMKACGVNLRDVMLPPALFGLLMTLLCVYVNHEVAPRAHEARRDITAMAGAGAGLKLLEPGHFIQDFPGMTFWFARREGDVLYNLIIFDKSRAGRNREIRAETAKVVVQGLDLHLDMRTVRVEPFSDTQPGVLTADRLTHVIPDAMKRRTYRRSQEDYGFLELRAAIVRKQAEVNSPPAADVGANAAEQQLAQREKVRRLSAMRSEMHRRFALAMAAFAFVLLGMPLGIRGQRRESTIGVAISLVVMVLYYVLVIGADSLTKRPEWHPHLLAWVPSVLCIALALWLIRRNR
ncbi:MAG: LptF/LptG family permease [Kiritimatiellae bacterium]|nr:LptF/LptG family permease [Kiritimatiellia bacterium]